MARIETVRIHPAIGIARVGNHPDAYFIGPEKPHFVSPEPPGGYKADYADGRKIKRQAARFRLYGYDGDGRLVGEITRDDAEISWSAHLANKKASWREFKALSRTEPWRNRNTPSDRRDTLDIDPGPRTVAEPGQVARFDTGSFTEWNVEPKTIENIYLGELRTDEAGRLLVLAGMGHAASPWNTDLVHSFNNDGWYDDVADGPVDASVVLDGRPIPVEGAWVICAPPHYAPAVGNLISFYDVLYQKYRDNGQYEGFVDRGLLEPVRAVPSWKYDVYPLLRRIYNVSFAMDIVKHRLHIGSDFLEPDFEQRLRFSIMGFVRHPKDDIGSMPQLLGDVPRDLDNPLTFTLTQYDDVLVKWARKEVELSGSHGATPSDDNVEITPQGLDRAALEHTVGGGLHPGIEASWFFRDDLTYYEPFRLDRHPAGQPPLVAGDVTKQLAVPWHTDMWSCKKQEGPEWGGTWGFWPGLRPDDVIPEGAPVDFDGKRLPWLRDWVAGREDMVRNWHRLGFVVEASKPGEPPVAVEAQRDLP